MHNSSTETADALSAHDMDALCARDQDNDVLYNGIIDSILGNVSTPQSETHQNLVVHKKVKTCQYSSSLLNTYDVVVMITTKLQVCSRRTPAYQARLQSLLSPHINIYSRQNTNANALQQASITIPVDDGSGKKCISYAIAGSRTHDAATLTMGVVEIANTLTKARNDQVFIAIVLDNKHFNTEAQRQDLEKRLCSMNNMNKFSHPVKIEFIVLK